MLWFLVALGSPMIVYHYYESMVALKALREVWRGSISVYSRCTLGVLQVHARCALAAR